MSLKESIPYRQILRVKRIFSTNSKFEPNFKVLQEQFTKRSYDSSSIETEIKKIEILDSKKLLTRKITQEVQVLSLTVTYNCRLLKIRLIIQSHWSILIANSEKAFSIGPIVASHKIKCLKQLVIRKIPSKAIKTKKYKKNKCEGKCTPCKS